MNATATLNPWDGEKLLYPGLVCWSCGKAASVANIPDRRLGAAAYSSFDGGLLVKLCANCLQDGLAAINAATLAQFPRVEPRLDSDDDGGPD